MNGITTLNINCIEHITLESFNNYLNYIMPSKLNFYKLVNILREKKMYFIFNTLIKNKSNRNNIVNLWYKCLKQLNTLHRNPNFN